jgi:hypothetical protein
MTRNHVFCAKAAEHLDGAVDAARKDLEAGGDGHIFRNWTMANITGMAGKTASFAWLLLNPNKSNLATVDTHMFRSLYPGYDELNTAEREAAQKELNKGLGYFMYERIFDARSKALGYPEGYKLGPTQWNFWDTIRSGESQPHDAFRTIDPTPAAEATWTTDAAPGSAQDISQVVPDWNQTQGAGMEVQNQFDQFHTELLQEAIKAGIFSAAKQYLSPEDIDYISQVRPDILNGIVRQASVKKARPADPEWWGQQSQEDPYVYHVTEKKNLPLIAEQGLVPWDSNASHTMYTDDSTPRADHIYFSTTPARSKQYANYISKNITLRVNKNQLDPDLINPDEDAVPFFSHSPDIPRYQVPHQMMDIANERVQEANKTDNYDEEIPDYGYGVIAEEVGYGDNPEDTTMGIERTNTLAYRGTVPPELIEYQEYEDDPWQPITNLLQQQLTAQAKAAIWDKPIHKLTRAELEYIATR